MSLGASCAPMGTVSKRQVSELYSELPVRGFGWDSVGDPEMQPHLKIPDLREKYLGIASKKYQSNNTYVSL